VDTDEPGSLGDTNEGARSGSHGSKQNRHDHAAECSDACHRVLPGLPAGPVRGGDGAGQRGLLIGAVIGAVIGLIAHALSGGRRDFSSVSTVRAERYDVLAEADVAAEMERAIAELGPLSASRRG
jgi:hypothetical protein